MENQSDIMPTRQNGDLTTGCNISLCEDAEAEESIKTASGTAKVSWSPGDESTNMGGLVYFAQYLEANSFFEHWVRSCPLTYASNNAPEKRDILGVILLSVLNGHNRYAHMTALRGDSLSSGLLGMKEVPSEDSVRRALRKLSLDDSDVWLNNCFDQMNAGLLEHAWILDVDVTIKLVYGNQEGAVIGYNPTKPGRPSHAYHSFWIARLRFCLGVEVRPGNETAGSYGLDALLVWLEKHPKSQHPDFVRGDIGYGNEGWMSALEKQDTAYLFRLRSTSKVKNLVDFVEAQGHWEATLDNWECCESKLQLTGWSENRRVVVYRRKHIRKKMTPENLNITGPIQEELFTLEVLEEGAVKYEYAIYVTSLSMDKHAIGPAYRDRGDNENIYDELKNQWGWGGFTVKDLSRCQVMASIIALIYNWWSVFVKFVDEEIAREAITSRPLLLNHVARATTHQSQKRIKVSCAHGFSNAIQGKLKLASSRLRTWSSLAAEQLRIKPIWYRIIEHIIQFHQTIGSGGSDPPLIAD
jgi:hypothetical protein